eukprot:TRINITY_DN68295_c0_g1_i1.p1 TRINITY_DN68295_c0_g1~~TRINITY_DN68295_c0_g1_i1.p1  ORF type:complete len:262 (-),score=29.24 TRINITY_DN68295_c0_g1_i1:90-875(-)
MMEVRVAGGPVSMYIEQAVTTLQGTDDTPPVQRLRILGSGSRVSAAAETANHVSKSGLGTIVKVSTGCAEPKSGKSGSERLFAQLIVEIRNCKPSFESVIFLDVDGVLHPAYDDSDDMFLPECMKRLHNLVKDNSAVLVVSSSWRESPKTLNMLNDELQKAGIEPAVSSTTVSRLGEFDNFQSRSDEILDWLTRHPSVRHFVAIDDSDLLDPHGEVFGKHFVRIDSGTAITDADVSRASEVLKLTVDRSSMPVPLRIKPEE